MSTSSRYSICKETLLTNIEYAKLKNINIVICLFDETVRLYTNLTISSETKEIIDENLKNKYTIFDSYSYDKIIEAINESHPMGGTDFLIPFELLSYIKEVNQTSEIFFLSDGQNCRKFTEDDLEYLKTYKNRVTTLGIGSKTSYDEITLSLMSKTNETIAGESSDIIQQELLAQMSDLSFNTIDIWKDVEITIMGLVSTLKIGSMMKVVPITENEYKATKFNQDVDNTNLIISKSGCNYMISKKHNVIDTHDSKIDTLVFIVDQSGSMASSANYDSYHKNSFSEIKPNEDLCDNIKYVKYTMDLPYMKSYQRIIFSSEDNNYKGQITWLDSNNIKRTMTLHNFNNYTNITDPIIHESINISNQIGHFINIANIYNDTDRIGYFRNINQICKKNTKFFDDILEKNLLTDFSLMENLFYNKKQGMSLFESTLSSSEKNMNNLLNNVSQGGGYKMFAASATMSAVCARTPSSQGGAPTAGAHYHGSDDEDDHNMNKNRDISMCSICYDEIREYVFSCGHCYACKSCAEKVLDSDPKNNCSYCKKEITWIRKIMMTEDQKNSEHYYKCISDDCYNIASVVAKCEPSESIPDDSGYHLTYCSTCYTKNKKQIKKSKISKYCFCSKEIIKIMDKIYFN